MTKWLREPSPRVCATECRSKCCRAPWSISLTQKEARRLVGLGEQHGVEVTTRLRVGGITLQALPPVLPSDSQELEYQLAFSDHPGRQCPFLLGTGLCRIHPERPQSCRDFPFAPTPACLVWPG